MYVFTQGLYYYAYTYVDMYITCINKYKYKYINIHQKGKHLCKHV